jgi:hypothetical protein
MRVQAILDDTGTVTFFVSVSKIEMKQILFFSFGWRMRCLNNGMKIFFRFLCTFCRCVVGSNYYSEQLISSKAITSTPFEFSDLELPVNYHSTAVN